MATESLIQSRGTPETFLLDDGRWYELRRGCLVDEETRQVITTSEQTTPTLMERGMLSEERRQHWAKNGPAICASAAVAGYVKGWGPCAGGGG